MLFALFSGAPLWTIWLWLGVYGICTALVAICELRVGSEGSSWKLAYGHGIAWYFAFLCRLSFSCFWQRRFWSRLRVNHYMTHARMLSSFIFSFALLQFFTWVGLGVSRTRFALKSCSPRFRETNLGSGSNTFGFGTIRSFGRSFTPMIIAFTNSDNHELTVLVLTTAGQGSCGF